jgi:4-hydroxy-tetrahydrodipicolinate synthase
VLIGSLVAIVTPMSDDGNIDYSAFKKLIDWHVESGTKGIVVAGTTGESATLTVEEHTSLIEAAVAHAAGRVPIIAGTGANSTTEAIELSSHAKRVGASCSLSVVPYYNKPGQEGLYLHFRTIAEAVDIPLILYNVPSRTVADLANETVFRLAEIENIIGIKDATADMGRGSELISKTPEDFAVYSGDDASFLPLMMLGSQGVISVTANIVPKQMQEVCDAVQSKDFQLAKKINDRLHMLHNNLFVEANPIPVKWGLKRMGRIGEGIRLPLTSMNTQFEQIILESLADAKVLV